MGGLTFGDSNFIKREDVVIVIFAREEIGNDTGRQKG
jgi:hypothetical protein